MKILPPEGSAVQQPIYDYTIELSGVVFRVVLTYRGRQDSWYLDLHDASGVALITGKRLAINWPPLRRYVIEGLPTGELVLIDMEGSGAECGYDDLGSRCLLFYFEPEDIPTLVSSSDITISIGAP